MIQTKNRGLTELITYRIDDDETVTEAITAAFDNIKFDIYNEETVLEDWINCECFDKMRWDSEESLIVSTVIWNHPTTITANAVTIHAIYTRSEPPTMSN